MPLCAQFARADTVEIKSQLFKKLGRQRAEKYLYNLKRLLSLKLSKSDFDKLCYSIIGKENVPLHNRFVRSILSNACLLSLGQPSKQTATGHSRTTQMPSGLRDAFPASLTRGRSIISREGKVADRPSPLGPHGKVHPGHVKEVVDSCGLLRSREQQCAPELVSIGSKALVEVASVEDGEEVEQTRRSPCVQSRSPLRAPLGVPKAAGCHSLDAIHGGHLAGFRRSKAYFPGSCCSASELPDTQSLLKQLKHKLKTEGLGVSMDCAHLLNTGLDEFLKRLIKSLVGLSRARFSSRAISQASRKNITDMNSERKDKFAIELNNGYCASLQDFQVAVESNPQLLGVAWPLHLEKINMRLLQDLE